MTSQEKKLLVKLCTDIFTEEDLNAFTESRRDIVSFLKRHKKIFSSFGIPVHKGYYMWGIGQAEGTFKYAILGNISDDEYTFRQLT